MKRYVKANKYPDFKTVSQAQQFLDSQDPAKVEFVDDCYGDILDSYADSDADDFFNKESEIMRDYKSEAAEDWSDLTVEEADKLFDEIFHAIEVVRADEAAAWT